MQNPEAMEKLIDACSLQELEQITQILATRATSNVAIVVTELIREDSRVMREHMIEYAKNKLAALRTA